MIGFFVNSENKWRATMQVANGVALCLTAYNMFSNPENVWENGFAIAVNALNMVTFSSDNNALTSIGTAALNFTRLGAIYAGVTSGCTNRTLVANMADVALQLTNVVTDICYGRDDDVATATTPAKQM